MLDPEPSQPYKGRIFKEIWNFKGQAFEEVKELGPKTVEPKERTQI